MPRFHLSLKLLVGIGAMLMPLIWLPTTSAAGEAADPTYIQVQPAVNGVSPATDVGLVSVTIAAPSPLTSLDVDIYSPDGTKQLDLTLSEFVQPANDGNGQFGTWTLATPITTSQLSLGGYSVYMFATDQGGDQVNMYYVGMLAFFNVVQYPVFTASSTTFNYANQDVTLSGTAMLLAPDGSTTPFAGKTLALDDPAPTAATVVTGADGSFSVTFQVTQSGLYSLQYAGDATTEANSTSLVQLTFDTFPVHITATLTAANVNAGASDSITGTVTYTQAGASMPLPDNTISIYPGAVAQGEEPTATAVTDANGNFSMAVPTMYSTDWTVWTTGTLYFPQTYTTARMTVAAANAITGFAAKMNSFAVVTYAGCITGGRGKVKLEYSTKPTGPWLPLSSTAASTRISCQQGKRFSGQASAKLTGAYYRAEYVATPTWQGAVSRSVFLHKYPTKISSFRISPRSVARNGTITVSGRLWELTESGKWKPYAHRSVIVVFRYQGTWYRYRHAPTTNSAGRFTGTFKVYASSPFFAQYNGDSTHFACATNRLRVTAAKAALTVDVLDLQQVRDRSSRQLRSRRQSALTSPTAGRRQRENLQPNRLS